MEGVERENRVKWREEKGLSEDRVILGDGGGEGKIGEKGK